MGAFIFAAGAAIAIRHERDAHSHSKKTKEQCTERIEKTGYLNVTSNTHTHLLGMGMGMVPCKGWKTCRRTGGPPRPPKPSPGSLSLSPVFSDCCQASTFHSAGVGEKDWHGCGVSQVRFRNNLALTYSYRSSIVVAATGHLFLTGLYLGRNGVSTLADAEVSGPWPWSL